MAFEEFDAGRSDRPPPLPGAATWVTSDRRTLIDMLFESKLEIARLEGYIERVKETDPPRPELVEVTDGKGIAPGEMMIRRLDGIEGKLRATDDVNMGRFLDSLNPEELELLMREAGNRRSWKR